VLGNLLASLMHNVPQLRRLYCDSTALCAEGVCALQPALRVNRTIKELDLSCCRLRDEGIRLISDALAGKTTMYALDIC
jgi:Leucine Rich repeat